MDKSIKLDRITLGVCYYPEHWPEEMWEDDLVRMKQHGLSVIRIAEFAWNKFEPEEGIYTFDFFDRFLEVAERQDMKVIFCTPTATPPAWLTQKYPEVLNADVYGHSYFHGMRRHYNYNSPVYRRFTEIIVDKIAAHYCPYRCIIGWQIDNELNCEMDVFYSEADHRAFREFLRKKYGSLDRLNDAWGTVFWNQTYTEWEQVHLTRLTCSHSPNPHLALDEKRFISHSAIEYCRLQSDIIRKYLREDQFITTNGLFRHIDYSRLLEESLDFLTYDSYPNFAFGLYSKPDREGNLKDRKWSCLLAETRAFSPNFGVMEQQSGANGWVNRMESPAPKPGQMRLWTFQSIAHGADFVSYFRWRTCWVGTEIYWHGLNDYSNEPNRRLRELQHIRKDVARISHLAGTRYRTQIALIRDYSNEWDGEFDSWHGRLSQFSHEGWFTACQLSHTPCDFIYLNGTERLEALEGYSALVYPHAAILTEQMADLLKQYVSRGGTLIMGARTGYKDEYGRCPMRPMPGFAGDICGVQVVDYTFLGPHDKEQKAVWAGEELDAPLFNDILAATGENARVEARFKGNYYDGQPALVCNRIGRGKAYYFGGAFSPDTAAFFLDKLGLARPYGHILELPRQCELAVRQGDKGRFIFVLNYMDYPVEVLVKKPMTDLLTDRLLEGRVSLEKYGILVLSHH